MANQKIVKIVNVKRSTPTGSFKQNMMESLWLKKEDKLREEGWLPESEIKEVKVETIADDKGKTTVVIEEETVVPVRVEAIDPETTSNTVSRDKDYSKMKVGELRAELKSKGIVFHVDSKKAKLIELLTEEK